MGKINLLGRQVSGMGIKPLPEKINAILNMKLPTNAKELSKQMRMLNWFRRFIDKFVERTRYISSLQMKKKERVKFILTEEARQKLTELRKKLKNKKSMKLPEDEKRYSIYTDASDIGVGNNNPRPRRGLVLFEETERSAKQLAYP